ncbi:hypothetical protein H2201_004067 [Coniosporium apollinis]|uniref:ABC transmembrane type-1 domain-containing protein n=1 Tax=Coniosporium apollinis TaxID=61459 RepID=A0ABQ9NTM1_9PEZI|nr:hypothetical protein H2201_004067 [Coniosporium apollinis]
MYIPTKRIPSETQPWLKSGMPQVSLDAAGLVALADLVTTAYRTALTGTSALLDAFVLCPGLHRQQTAPQLNGGEYPAVAAMTSGYVFRVENPATVVYLQKVGLTGQLTTLSVTNIKYKHQRWARVLSMLYSFENSTAISSMAYIGAVFATFIVLTLMILSEDWWGVFVILLLVFARLCNTLVIRQRNQLGWQGASEPGKNGDLLILLSQDRWIRMRGAIDDLKAVTSGQWLRDKTFFENSISAFATLLVYLDAALASNISQLGKVLLLVLLATSAGLLAIANAGTEALQMHGNIIKIHGPRRKYKRRLELAEQLIKETGRDDWAARLGMVVPKADDTMKLKHEGAVTM